MNPQEQTTVKLKAPHTHEGTTYPVGAELQVSQADANWMIANGVAIDTVAAEAKSETTATEVKSSKKQ